MRTIKIIPAILVALVIVCMTCGCGDASKPNSAPSAQAADQNAGSQRKTVADSLITEAIAEANPERMLKLADSLEKTGDFSSTEANYYRGGAYTLQQKVTLANSYLMKAIGNKKSVPQGRDLKPYLSARSLLAQNLLEKNFESALHEALPLSALMDSLGDASTYSDKVRVARVIASSQLNLELTGEANKTSERLYGYIRQWFEADSTCQNLHSILAHMINVNSDYLDAHQFDRAMTWAIRADSIWKGYTHRPKADSTRLDFFRGAIDLGFARTYQGLGNTAKAVELYQEFQNSAFAKHVIGRINSTYYLLEARRFAEAADNLKDLDHIFEEAGYDMSLDNIKSLILPKLRANLGAGRRDSALAVAATIAEVFDSAFVGQKRSEAADLATIYEVQEKERSILEKEHQLTEQDAKLLRVRLRAWSAGFLATALFLIIFTVNRHRHARRMEEKNKELEVANARAEESSRMKSDFIQQISHEIRTPLNILSGFTQIITTPGMELDDDTRQDINQQITDNTNRITNLVNKMLELSDANSLAVIERADQVPAVQIAAEAADASGITQADHLVFDMQLSPESEEVVLTTNQQAATRALTLLLDNARKFTKPAEADQRNFQPTSQEEKKQTLLRMQVDNGQMLFIVEDDGIGIPPSEAEHIFEEFVQLDEYYDGTGIGLTVARSMARRLGGDITLDTSYSKGARFVFTLPI